jgi:glycosyltransferase involved in cell wall biosynthesis
MKLGIDISQIVYEGTGVARFTKGFVESILQYDTDNQWVFFSSLLRRKLDPILVEKIKSKGHHMINWHIPPRVLSVIWNDFHHVSNLLTSHFLPFTSLDWFITSEWTEPALPCKKATIVHDLIFKKFPETVDSTILKTQEQRLKWVAKESDIIFADSQSTANDLEELYAIDEKRIVVNYPGLEINNNLQATSYKLQAIPQKYNINQPFILTVGKIEPRKNLQRLIEAFSQLPITHYQLLIIGPPGWGTMKPVENPNIRFLGFIPDEDLYALYHACHFFIFPSIYEGFGYPALEAMSCSAPTALADTSSLKEIGHNASLLFDPFNVNSIYDALQEMIQNETLRNELKQKGLEKSKQFTWVRYYNLFIKTLKEST